MPSTSTGNYPPKPKSQREEIKARKLYESIQEPQLQLALKRGDEVSLLEYLNYA
jgi:hypothetical protein